MQTGVARRPWSSGKPHANRPRARVEKEDAKNEEQQDARGEGERRGTERQQVDRRRQCLDKWVGGWVGGWVGRCLTGR